MADELSRVAPMRGGETPPVQLLVERVRNQLPSQPATPDVVGAYQLVLDGLTREVAMLLGPLGAEAVIGRAVQIAGRQSPLLHGIQILDGRLNLGAIREQADQLEAAETEMLLTEFTDAVLGVLCTLIGLDLLTPLLKTLFMQPTVAGRED